MQDFTQNRFIKLFLLLFILCSLSGSLLGQDIIMGTTSSPKTVITGDIFYDSGGSTGNYGAFEDETIILKSAEGSVIRVTFTEFDVQNGDSGDYLEAYDGSSTSSLIGRYYGTWMGAPHRPDIITSTGNSLTFLFESDEYEYRSGWKATIDVLNENEVFCFPSIKNVGWGDNKYISNVKIGAIDNLSGSNEYTDYTSSFSTDVEIGTNYPLTITNGNYNTWGDTPVYCVWVDWNQDGDFDEANETIASEVGVGVFTVTITPPLGAVSGSTRMRIRLNHTDMATPCETTDWGEVEDYTLNVISGSLLTPTISLFTPSNACFNSNQQVIITGTNFISVTDVNFNGISVLNPIIDSDTQITAILPTNATTGFLSITTAGGNVTSGPFNVNSLPVVPTGDSNQLFYGSATVNDLVAISADKVDWYSAGGIALYDGDALSDATTYYGEAKNSITGCVSSSRFAVMITIKDITPPVFQNTPTDIAINASGDACGEVVNYTMPSATDNRSAYSGTLAGFSYLGELDNHTYYYSDGTAIAIDAMLVATNVGGHLVTITSQAENDFIDNLVGGIWIGINDAASEGTFVWSNGEAVSYSNWSGGEPNDYSIGEDYSEMNSSGKWNDLPETYLRKYVIEFEGALVTQTTGFPSGSAFPVGITTNTFAAIDNAGNTTTQSFTVSVADVTPPKISALRADYYDGINFDTYKETLDFDELNYDWAYGAPESSLVGSDDFSIRFQGSVQAVDAGTYTFSTTSDDGVRLLVNGDTIINNWTLHGSTVNTGDVTLSAGQIVPIVLEYYEHTGEAIVKLQWEGPGLSKQFVKSNSFGSGSCQDVVVDVSATGFYNLTIDEADPGYADECGIASRILSQTHFTCSDLGSNPVTLTVTDVHGNSTECSFNVIVTGAPANDLTVLGDTECMGSDANFTIQASENGVMYSAYKDGVQIGSSVTGDGSDILISVPTTGFSEGNNTISFKAQSGACSSDLTNTAVLVLQGIPTPLGIYHE